MAWEVIVTLLTLFTVLAALVVTRVSTDLVLMAALAFLLITGILGPAEALAGFASQSGDGDVALLSEHYLKQLAEEYGKPPIVLSADALEALSRYSWPGNVRQLKNIIESTVIFHPGGEVAVDQLPSEIREATLISGAHAPVQPRVGRPRTMDEIERQAILETLQRTKGHRAGAARMLGIGLRTLQRKLKDYREQGYYEDD